MYSLRDFPRGLVVKTLHFSAEVTVSISGQGTKTSPLQKISIVYNLKYNCSGIISNAFSVIFF